MCPECKSGNIGTMPIKDWSNPHTIKEKLVVIVRHLCRDCGNVWFI